MNRWDAALATLLLVTAAAAWPLSASAADEGVRISGPRGETRFASGVSGEWRIEGRIGVVVVRTGPEGARVVDSGCPDRSCVRTGIVKRGTVTCAPNGVVVRVGGMRGDIDAVNR